MVARCKLNSIEALISQALINSEISHKDFATIINQKEYYRRLKEYIRLIKIKEVKLRKMSCLKKGKELESMK